MIYSRLKENILRYKWLILLLVVYFAILVYCSPLDITQYAAGDKCFAHIYTAATGQRIYTDPIYTMLSVLFTRLPFSDGFSLSFFLSIIPSVICVALVYFAIKKQTDVKGAPLFGSIALASSWMFVSQAVKVEVYPILAMLLILGYLFAVCKKGTLAAITFGLALAGHWVDAIPIIFAMFIYSREFRRRFYISLIIWIGMYCMWTIFPTYRGGLFDTNLKSSMIILFNWYGGGSFKSIIGNMSRIPIVIFMIGFGWIPAFLYFVKDYRKAAPIIFIVGILVMFIIVAPGDSAFQEIGTIIPFLAVASGLGFGYIISKGIRKIVVCGTCITLLLIPAFWHIDTNPTTARDMINQLNNIPDNSIVACYRYPSQYSNSVIWTVDYYNFEHNKHLHPVIPWELIEPSKYPKDINDMINLGLVIPSTEEIYGNSSITLDYVKLMNALAACNPGVDIYYYKMIDIRSMRCELTLWGQ